MTDWFITKLTSFLFLLKKAPGKLFRIIYFPIRERFVKIRPNDLNTASFDDFKPKCVFLAAGENKLKYLERIVDWQLEAPIVWEAERVCRHIFNILGSGDCRLGEKIAWNVDFKTGYRWENNFYRRLKVVDLMNPADVKVVWEISRFQHLFVLGKAYWLTGNEKYALEFAQQIEDWIKNNPVEFSVNWTCAMEVAIRAVNWIAAYFFFQESPSLDKRFWTDFQRVLYLHGKYIKGNLENRAQYNGNHYLADLMGLIWLGIYFGDHYVSGERSSNNPKTWLAFAVPELERQLFIQVNPDGTNYESSTAYHRLVTEIFLLTTVFCTKNGIYYSKRFINRLNRMLFFIVHLMKPDGLCPFLGDGDDGRVLIFANYYTWEKQDFRYLLAIAGEFFEYPFFRHYGQMYREDALWATDTWQESASKMLRPGSKGFRQGGYYFLKNDRLYLLMRCGELSCHGQGAHSHNDQLSMVLNWGGVDVIVDPGLYVYSADYRLRNLFRCTGVHNTLCIEGLEQNPFNGHDLFAMPEQSDAECLEYSPTGFKGIHHGYQKKLGLIHERSVRINGDEIVVRDSLRGCAHARSQKVDWYLNFTLAPDIEVLPGENGIGLKKELQKDKCLFVLIHLESDQEIKVEVKTGFISKGYGRIEKTKRLIVRGCNSENNSLTLRFSLQCSSI